MYDIWINKIIKKNKFSLIVLENFLNFKTKFDEFNNESKSQITGIDQGFMVIILIENLKGITIHYIPNIKTPLLF